MQPNTKQPLRDRISAKQLAGLAAVVVACAAFVYFEALVVGYVFVTLLLCAFFVVVAFDIGVPKRTARAEEADVDQTDRAA